MKYSKGTLIRAIKVANLRSMWTIPEKEIEHKRNQLRLFGMESMRKIHHDIQVEERTFSGHKYYELIPKQACEDKMIFYSHGGGYVYDITSFHWDFLSNICQNTGVRIVVPIYPLAPEHRKEEIFPWIYSLYYMIIDNDPNGKVILMGDSAGGGISLAIAIASREDGIKTPSATILISPWLDIRMNTLKMQEINKHDPMLDLDGLLVCGNYYLGNGCDDLTSSPLNGNFHEIENISVFTGTMDVLNPISAEFKSKCVKQGVQLNYFEYQDSIHVFPIFRTEDGLESRLIISDLINGI